MKTAVVEDQGHQSRDSRRHLVAQASRESVARSIAPRTWQRPPAGGQDDAPRNGLAFSVSNHEPGRLRLACDFCAVKADNIGDSMTGTKDYPERPAASEERLQHGPRLVGHRKQFTGLLALEVHTERSKPPDRFLHRKGGEHIANQMAGAEKIIRRHHIMGDIAAAAAGNQDLGADSLCPVQQFDSQMRVLLGGKNTGRQPGRSGAYDTEIDRCHCHSPLA